MAPCIHMTLDYVGDQKTEDGVNVYHRCRDCGSMVVVTPSKLAFTVMDASPGKSQHDHDGHPKS